MLAGTQDQGCCDAEAVAVATDAHHSGALEPYADLVAHCHARRFAYGPTQEP